MLQTNEKDNKKIEYIALYCRVDSANSQVNTLGILTQKKRLALWAEQQGFTPEQIIYLVDSGFSGRTLDRPGIQKFLSGDRKYAIMAAMVFPGSAVICSLLTNLLTMPTPRERRSMC